MIRKPLSRRMVLKGMGASLALPVLEAMTPAPPPLRLAIAYVPNGIVMKHWTPASEGNEFAWSRILAPLAAHRADVLVLSGLTHNNGRALGDGAGDHARAAASFLTGAHPRKTAGADIQNGVSLDQVAASHIGARTRFASLEICCEDGRLVGNCDSGYSCAYSNSISWRSGTQPNPPEVNPRAVFERLFGESSDDPATAARHARYHKSILDGVLSSAQRIQAGLGVTDRRKLDEYFTSVREIERRIEAAEAVQSGVVPSMDKPAGIPVDYAEHARLLFDLQAAAFQTDATRVITFMMGREGSTRAYREIGISDSHHPLTHHRNQEDMVEKVAQINCYHVEQFAYFVGKLKSITDGEGTLLDHTLALYGSGLSDGNRHDHGDLPVVMAGKACGKIQPGRHVRYAKDTPMNNLFVTILGHMGVPVETLGDSKGPLEHLAV